VMVDQGSTESKTATYHETTLRVFGDNLDPDDLLCDFGLAYVLPSVMRV
jgi:hypothetical protein